MQRFQGRDYRSILATGLLSILVPVVSSAAEPEEPIYGRHLLTQQERQEHREQIRSAKSWEEREQLRREHHEGCGSEQEPKGLRFQIRHLREVQIWRPGPIAQVVPAQARSQGRAKN